MSFSWLSPQCRSISESLDRVGWIKRSGSTVYGRNQADPSLRFLVYPANKALIERHWLSPLLYDVPTPAFAVVYSSIVEDLMGAIVGS